VPTKKRRRQEERQKLSQDHRHAGKQIGRLLISFNPGARDQSDEARWCVATEEREVSAAFQTADPRWPPTYVDTGGAGQWPEREHENEFQPPCLSGRSRLGETTFAGIGGKEEDAPIPVIRGSRWNLGDRPTTGPRPYLEMGFRRRCLKRIQSALRTPGTRRQPPTKNGLGFHGGKYPILRWH